MLSVTDRTAEQLERRMTGMLPRGAFVRAARIGGPSGLEPDLRGPHRSPGMSESRLAEFITGRALAGEALAAAGSRSRSVGRTSRGAPIWPHGYSGSITHAEQFCLAAVIPTVLIASLGIDLECAENVTPELAMLIRRVDEQSEAPLAAYFAAKEAVFKAQYPLTLAEAEFTDVRISWRPDDQFEAVLKNCWVLTPRIFMGQCVALGPYVLASAWPASPRSHCLDPLAPPTYDDGSGGTCGAPGSQ